jgi:hypothetical protein
MHRFGKSLHAFMLWDWGIGLLDREQESGLAIPKEREH